MPRLPFFGRDRNTVEALPYGQSTFDDAEPEPTPEEIMEDEPWANEYFDIDRRGTRKRLITIYRATQRDGQEWSVLCTRMRATGRGGLFEAHEIELGKFSDIPLTQDIELMALQQGYGGGGYLIKARLGAQSITKHINGTQTDPYDKQVEAENEAKAEAKTEREATRLAKERKSGMSMDDVMAESFREVLAGDPDLRKKVATAKLAEMGIGSAVDKPGVKPEKNPTLNQVIDELAIKRIQDNPEVMESVINGRMAKTLGIKKSEFAGSGDDDESLDTLLKSLVRRRMSRDIEDMLDGTDRDGAGGGGLVGVARIVRELGIDFSGLVKTFVTANRSDGATDKQPGLSPPVVEQTPAMATVTAPPPSSPTDYEPGPIVVRDKESQSTMEAQPVSTPQTSDDDDPLFTIGADGAQEHNADGSAVKTVTHSVADAYNRHPQWSPAVQGPRYERESLGLNADPIGDNHWADRPASSVEDARAMLDQIIPSGRGIDEWFLGLDWEGFGNALQRDASTFAKWVFDTANAGSWQAQTLWDVLRTQHPITVLLVLDQAKNHPVAASFPKITDVLNPLTDMDGSHYIGQAMAVSQEAVKRQTGETGEGLADLNPNLGDPSTSFMDDVDENDFGDDEGEIDEEPLIHTVADEPKFPNDQPVQ